MVFRIETAREEDKLRGEEEMEDSEYFE